jgi:hypothetical protein
MNNSKAESVKYPIKTQQDGPDGTIIIETQESESSTKKKEILFPDGKRITDDGDGVEVTRYPKGNIEFVLPKSKIKVEIRVGSGDDVLESRKALNGKSNEAMFFKAMYSQLCRFDGQYMIPEDIGRKLPMGDFLTLEQYFAEVNFS